VTHPFAVTFDYRCPFARNAHEHVLDGLEAGAEWDVRFVPFSLSQAKEETPSWDLADDPSLWSMALGVAVRDTQPEVFLAAHRALFALRHDDGLDIRELDVVQDALRRAGVDVDAAMAEVTGGAALKTLRTEHEWAVDEHAVWGVPTFISEGQSVFVRLMDRPAKSTEPAEKVIERVVDLVAGVPALNEFKHTSIPR
jgi:hypothetical protein